MPSSMLCTVRVLRLAGWLELNCQNDVFLQFKSSHPANLSTLSVESSPKDLQVDDADISAEFVQILDSTDIELM